MIVSVTPRQLSDSPTNPTHHRRLEVQSVVKHGARLPVLDFDEPRALGRAPVHCALGRGLPPRRRRLEDRGG